MCDCSVAPNKRLCHLYGGSGKVVGIIQNVPFGNSVLVDSKSCVLLSPNSTWGLAWQEAGNQVANHLE
jgi:hypothetical protein